MDATQADIYLVSRLDRSEVLGRPYIYLAVDTATQLIAGVYVGMDAGEQAYIVCPMIEEGESDLLAVTSYAEQLRAGEFAAYRVGLLPGKMKPAEKEQVMASFTAARDGDFFTEHRRKQPRAQTVENGRHAEHRVIPVAGEQTPDKIGHEPDQRAGQRAKEHTGQEDRHGFERKTGRLIGHRNDEPGQNDGYGGQQRAGHQRPDVLQTMARRGLRSGGRHVFGHKKASYCFNGRRFVQNRLSNKKETAVQFQFAIADAK